MEAFRIVVVLQALVCYGAKLYITQTSRPCSWTVTSPDENQRLPAFKQPLHPLATQVCQTLGCGEVYELKESAADPNSSCLTGCIHHNSTLINCSRTAAGGCMVMSEVICGNNKVRLSGGSHRCAGRVELWRAGQWGTVCDDEWDTQDADVVCAQLGCGYAISVTGQGDPYSQGRGPIQLDDLNCTGKERSLWECPAVMDDHDCGHKEDAGVVCSEYKALRLTGGQDRCSGRVEIHRNGLWGTVCDDSWDKQEAFLACAMLDCGVAKTFTGFEKPFTHKSETRWYYMCPKNPAVLWDCTEIDTSTKPHFCTDSKAAGVICNNSAGLPVPPSPKATTPALTTVQMTTAGPKVLWSLERLSCIVLSLALLSTSAFIIILCCQAKKKNEVRGKTTTRGSRKDAPRFPDQSWEELQL
ncbi:T-cell differentiation antigen CD6-like [Salminus brasiliensis]|uniref:T-cell differentiation antigen CD6-like n=1 Tax=Salminus brasiliensis TaxID=930266 RepID=UPI003B832F77